MMISLNSWITLDDVYRVVFGDEYVELDEKLLAYIDDVRKSLREAVESGSVIYGVNTGLGALSTQILEKNDLEKLQENLLESHSVGIGEYLPDKIAKATTLLRLISLSKAKSGIRSVLLEMFKEFINRNIIPIIPTSGSVGASGDLAPLSHLALAIIGHPKGAIKVGDNIYSGNKLREILIKSVYPEILRKYPKFFNLKDVDKPLFKLEFKEGLALINGTSYTAAILVYSIYKLEKLFYLSEISLALTLEAMCGLIDAFKEKLFHSPCEKDPKCLTARDIRGFTLGSKLIHSSAEEIRIADLIECSNALPNKIICKVLIDKAVLLGLIPYLENLFNRVRKILNIKGFKIIRDGSKIFVEFLGNGLTIDRILNTKVTYGEIGYVQDAYSLRCSPQVYGPVRETINFAKSVLEREINLPNDNPLIFKEGMGIDVVSGGNFHGQALGLISDYLAISITTLSNIIERRIFKLLDPSQNRGLPPFLAPKSGVNSGLMLTQYLAADLVAENRQLSNPQSVHSIPTSANQEDHVSMSAKAAYRLLKMIENLETIISVELLVASQAISLRIKGLEANTVLGKKTSIIYNEIQKIVGKLPIYEDRVFKEDIMRIRRNLYYLYEKIVEK